LQEMREKVCQEAEMGKVIGLKRCPFCGAQARVYPYGIIYAECTGCRNRTKACSTVEDAARAWNRRAYPEGETGEDIHDFFESDAD